MNASSVESWMLIETLVGFDGPGGGVGEVLLGDEGELQPNAAPTPMTVHKTAAIVFISPPLRLFRLEYSLICHRGEMSYPKCKSAKLSLTDATTSESG